MHTTEVPSPDAPNQDGLLVGEPLSFGVRVSVLTLGWLACVSGVFGNVLIITTLLSQQALRSVHNIYIANLAVADLLVVGYVLVFWLLDLSLGYQPVLNQAHCEVNAYILVTSLTASIYTLLVISFNRYLSVCHSTVYAKIFSKRSTIVSCVCVWVVGCLEAAIPLSKVGGKAYIYKKGSRLCSFDNSDPTNTNAILSLLNLFLPTILVGFFSVSILRFWKKQKTRIGHWTQTARPKTRLKVSSSDMSLIRSLTLVFALLVILYIPLAVSMAVYRHTHMSSDVYVVMLFFFFLNSSINWIVYGLMNKNFRRGYKRIMYGCCHGHLPAAESARTINTVATFK